MVFTVTSTSWFTPGEQRGSALGVSAEGFGSDANLNWPELSFWVELYVHCRFPVKAESSWLPHRAMQGQTSSAISEPSQASGNEDVQNPLGSFRNWFQ